MFKLLLAFIVISGLCCIESASIVCRYGQCLLPRELSNGQNIGPIVELLRKRNQQSPPENGPSLSSNGESSLIEIELPALSLKGHEMSGVAHPPSPGHAFEPGTQSHQDMTTQTKARAGQDSSATALEPLGHSQPAKRTSLAFLTLLSHVVSEKRKFANQGQTIEFELTEPRRKNRNRDFQTNGW